MKKCLILGCSFSAGAYYIDKDLIIPEEPDPLTGYYAFIDMPNVHYTVYSIRAGGYLNYAMLLSDGTINVADYDFILIQESFEPRVHTLKHDVKWQVAKNDNITHNLLDSEGQLLNMGHRVIDDKVVIDQTDIWRRYNVQDSDGLQTWWKDVTTNHRYNEKSLRPNPNLFVIIRGAITLINHLLKDKPSFVFSFQEGTYQHSKQYHTHCQYLKVPILQEIIYKNRNWHNYVPEKNYLGHPNIEGCKEIGRILSKAFLQSSRMQLL